MDNFGCDSDDGRQELEKLICLKEDIDVHDNIIS